MVHIGKSGLRVRSALTGGTCAMHTIRRDANERRFWRASSLLAVLAASVIVFLARDAIAQGTWTTGTDSPTARRGEAAAAVNGILYAVGGAPPGSTSSVATVEAYDPMTDTWTSKASMPVASQQLTAGVINGILYAAAGGGCCGAFNTLQAYDPTTDSWTLKPSMPTPRYGPAAGVVNDILYVAGGGSGFGTIFANLEAFDPTTNGWTTKAPMPTGRSHLGIGVVNGILYAIGGANLAGTALATVEAYDPATNTWSTGASMPTARLGLTVDVIDGVLYAIGGLNSSGSLTTVEAYNPATDSWTSMTSMPVARNFNSLASDPINGVLYVVGGKLPDTTSVLTVQIFTPVLFVKIDIKPGSDPNSINLGSVGVVPVAILSSATFDATQVDPESVTLAGGAVRLIGRGSKYACSKEDINGDGVADLVCHVETAQFMIEPGSTSAVLTGTTFGGQSIRGEDSIQIVQ